LLELETEWAVTHLKWREFFSPLDFRRGVCEASFLLGYEVTSLDALFQMYRTGQWSENVDRRMCADVASRSRRIDFFYFFENSENCCSVNRTVLIC